jgi:hypothetical protein
MLKGEFFGTVIIIVLSLLVLWLGFKLVKWCFTTLIPKLVKIAYWCFPASMAFIFCLSGEWWSFIPVLCAIIAYIGMFCLHRWWVNRD